MVRLNKVLLVCEYGDNHEQIIDYLQKNDYIVDVLWKWQIKPSPIDINGKIIFDDYLTRYMVINKCNYDCIIFKGNRKPSLFRRLKEWATCPIIHINEPYDYRNKKQRLVQISFSSADITCSVDGVAESLKSISKYQHKSRTAGTALYCTSYINSEDALTRYMAWIDYYTENRDKLGVGPIFMIDDGSPMEWLDKIDAEVINIKHSPDYKHFNIPCDIVGNKLKIFRFPTNLGRPTMFYVPGWYRSWSFAAMLAMKFKFDKLIFIESDAYVVTNKLFDFIKNSNDKWYGMWTPSKNWIESSIQWLPKEFYDAIAVYWKRGLKFWWSHDLNELNYAPEFLLPLNVNPVRWFKGDRYPDFGDIPPDCDYVCNVHDISLGKIFHPDENNIWQQLERILKSNGRKFDIQKYREMAKGEFFKGIKFNFDATRLITNMSILVHKNMRDMLNDHIFEERCGYKQADDTYALFKYKARELQSFAINTFAGATTETKQQCVNKAQELLKMIIETTVEG
jgi:hypothetical protein